MTLEAQTLDELAQAPQCTSVLIKDEDSYNLSLKSPEIRRTTFSNVDAREAVISQGHIQRATFDRCYLRNARFEAVDLTGTSTTITSCRIFRGKPICE